MADERMITLRFFAAARQSAGAAERRLAVEAAATIGAALDAARGEAADYDEVIGRCSFLVNGVATLDRDASLVAGDVVDVLPPFAGG